MRRRLNILNRIHRLGAKSITDKGTITSLTLEEKASLLQGWRTWTTWDGSKKGIPAIFLSDGPHGLRKQAGAGEHLGLNAFIPAACFPTAATMANSLDEFLGEELGRALCEEAAAENMHVLLGPIFVAVKSVSIRIEEAMVEKLGYVADYEGRSINSHILCLVRENIKNFEKEHGAISGDVDAAENVKPPRK